ncbi:MAG: exodeoxyribonuclease VII small subunit [Deltaproteobacteria bacterium]|nr:exodeoxyribonuclease VII small subunit [Deltaproteobacteria bacterium]
MAKENFEDSFKKLEKIVIRMEDGNLPLEESLKLFEEGMRLYAYCANKLGEVQKKVELLTQGPDGKFSGRPFPLEEERPGDSDAEENE